MTGVMIGEGSWIKTNNEVYIWLSNLDINLGLRRLMD